MGLTSTDFSGKRMLVVGGGSGIGLGLARALVSAGAEVVISGRDADALHRAMSALGSQGTAIPVDLTGEASIAELAGRVGKLDGLVSTAAIHANGPVSSLSWDAVAAAFEAKIIGPLMLVKHLAPLMNAESSILLFAGVAANRPASGRSVMAVTNAAVNTLVKVLALELAPIRVNAISPGIIDSGMWDGMGAGKAAFLEAVAARNPSRRYGEIADVVSASLLALSNTFINAETINVDGGGSVA